MNKFLVFPCSEKDNKEGYNGYVVPLICASATGFAIFFPISKENAEIINTVLEKKINKSDLNTGSILSVYRTMVDSWNSGGRYLSGIYMDLEIDPNDSTEIISIKAIISNNQGGYIDNVIKINFIHAIIIAAMYRFEIIVSKELIEKLLPHLEDDKAEKNENEDEDQPDGTEATLPNSPNSPNSPNLPKKSKEKEEKYDSKKFPKDTQILKIAKKIMNGKIK